MIKRVGKKGDTLVEVMLAVGIFSMVAVAVVAVMSSGTSSSQVALETTLTREEIDTQAEALRFIHSAYITAREADPEGGESSPYAKLWHAITDKAIDFTDEGRWNNEQEKKAILQYSPSDCSALYSNDAAQARAHGFIINTRALSGFDSLDPSNETDINNAINKIVVTGQAKENIIEGAEITTAHFLTPTTTYPRLIFRNNLSNTDGVNLISDNSFDDLYRAEGIYTVAVKDPSSTTLYDKDEKQLETDTAAYFDFYVRSCWYGTGDQTPSNISTVMRLYDPEVIEYDPVIIDTPTVGDLCDHQDAEYILIDTNMYISNRAIDPSTGKPIVDPSTGKTESNSYVYSGVQGISLDFNISHDENGIITTQQVDELTNEHYQCLSYDSAPLLRIPEDGETLIFPEEVNEWNGFYTEKKCPSGSTRLKVRTGNVPPDKNLDNDPNSDKGGDFWYPVRVGDTLRVTLRSSDFTLYYDDSGDTEGENPFICDQIGVRCKFCKDDDGNSCTDDTTIEWRQKGVEGERVDINGTNKLIVDIIVNSCATNDTANGGAIPSISVNTSWFKNNP